MTAVLARLPHDFDVALSRSFEPVKPDPAPLLHILREVGANANESVMVGDSIDDMDCGIGEPIVRASVRPVYRTKVPKVPSRWHTFSQRPELQPSSLARSATARTKRPGPAPLQQSGPCLSFFPCWVFGLSEPEPGQILQFAGLTRSKRLTPVVSQAIARARCAIGRFKASSIQSVARWSGRETRASTSTGEAALPPIAQVSSGKGSLIRPT